MADCFIYKERIKALRNLGLVIDDEEMAIVCLKSIGYNRLLSYFFAVKGKATRQNSFYLSSVLDLYQFDTDLRNLLIRLIAPIEVRAKAAIGEILEYRIGDEALFCTSLFSDVAAHSRFLEALQRETTRAVNAKVPVVSRHYEISAKLPVGVSIDLLSLGSISALYSNLSDSVKNNDGLSLKSEIADAFGTSGYYLQSWLHHLTAIRNICAHNDRFYAHLVKIKPKLLKSDRKVSNSSQFSTFLVLKHLCSAYLFEQWDTFLADFIRLKEDKAGVPLEPMGFPFNWREMLYQ